MGLVSREDTEHEQVLMEDGEESSEERLRLSDIFNWRKMEAMQFDTQ